MPTAVEHIPRTQISTLENGLKSLRHSKLINSKELKCMYDAIEKHHRDIRLAHLTGKPKDLIEQSKKDTKFFFILVKLLSETLNGTRSEQQESLREVYSWYVGNKHTLASAPRFGRQNEKKKSKTVALASSRPVSGLSKLGHVNDAANKALEKDFSEELRELAGLPSSSEIDLLNQRQKLSSPDASIHRQSSMSMSAYRSEVETPDSCATKRISESQQHLLPKRQPKPLAHLYNPHSRDFTSVRPPDSSRSDVPMRLTIQTYDARDTARSSLMPDNRNIHLRKWEDFQQQVAYGQDTLNMLQHCGRTGVAGGQRYVAHDGGLAAEQYTPCVINAVVANPNQQQQDEESTESELSNESPEPMVPLEKQSLEEFWKTTQGYYPAKVPKYPSQRLRSAPSGSRQMAPRPPTSGRLQSTSLVGFSSFKEEGDDKETESVKKQELTIDVSGLASERSDSPDRVVKLDTVVTMIDSVTDEMTFFKEKLIPDPMPGFRQPTVEVNPDDRPQTAPSLGSHARPSSPLNAPPGGGQERPGTALSAISAPPGAAFLPVLLPPSSGASGYPEVILEHDQDSISGRGGDGALSHSGGDARSVRSFTTEEWNVWRERFAHENSRYKWQATPAGGHAYYRKASARPGSRSAGKGPSGSRPKTAPQTPRERWNTAVPSDENKQPPVAATHTTTEPSDENKKAPVAATHTTTEVDQETTDSMFAVRRLGGKNAKNRRYRFFYDFRSDSREMSRSAMNTPAMEYLTFIAPKPVAGSRASSAVTRSRISSAVDGHTQPEDENPENNEDEDIDSMGDELDLPEMDDLDDDLDDNFQYEGDAPLEGEQPFEDEVPFQSEEPLTEEHTVTLTPPQNGLESTDQAQDSASLQDDVMSGSMAGSEAGTGSNMADEQEEDEDQDFDSVCIRSSTQDSEEMNVDQQCTESRQLIQEIETLVTHGGKVIPPNGASRFGAESRGRPYSSHSRVTFMEDPEKLDENAEIKEPLSEQGRKTLKPKSILVPRHIQPPPSVGLTIRQFHGGNEGVSSQRASHTPLSAPGASSVRSKQVLSQSQHWSFDPAEIKSQNYEQNIVSSTSANQHHVYKLDPNALDSKLSPGTPHNTARSLTENQHQTSTTANNIDNANIQNSTERSTISFAPSTRTQSSSATKPRLYIRAFPKSLPVHPVEFDTGLKVEGRNGPRSRSRSAAVQGRLHANGLEPPLSQRSAGVSPIRSRSASHLKMLQKQQAMLKKAPASANRSAPSIPSGSNPEGPGALATNGPFSAEHDSHARRQHSPRKYMEKVGVLRKSEWVPTTAKQGRDGYLTTTLRVSRMQPSTRADSYSPELPNTAHPGTPIGYYGDPDRISEKSEEVNSGRESSKPVMTLTPRVTSAAPGSSRSQGGGGSRVYIYSGRPIPDYASVKTPEESKAADQLQKEAAAAVNIQKNFRGYVARRDYNFLLREERHKREDRQLAALQIQKAYRNHLLRTRRIYSRPVVTPETLQWARDFKRIQEEKAIERNGKAGAVAMQNSMNKARADAKLAIIGPHVEVYAPFHPKKTGASKEVLNAAATCLQRHLKGWLVRKKMHDLKRKARLHASSWSRFLQQYKDLIKRIQLRHGNNRPSVPFSFKHMHAFMDIKKMYESKFIKIASSGYESGFESHAFAGELEFDELPDYFRECDLYPVQGDIDQAIDVVLRGQPVKKGLQKHQVMEITFQLYPPSATGITNSRKSTWTNPIIDGEEGNKILGSELIEDTDFALAWKLVAGTVRERHEKEEKALAAKEAANTKAKLEAIKAKGSRRPSQVQMLAVQEEEEEASTTGGSSEKGSDVTEKSKDKRVTFTENVEEHEIQASETEQP